MEYRIKQIGGNLSNRISLSLVTEIEKSDNELQNIINDNNRYSYLSHDDLISRYLSDRENLIIKDIKIEYVNNYNDIVICAEYFQYGQNNQGEYYFDESTNTFSMTGNDFNNSGLCDKVSVRIQEINNNKKSINDLIDAHKENINTLNEHVKPLTENVICEYLEASRLAEYMNVSNLSFEDFDRYIRENYAYIKEFIRKNWKYKKVFELTLKIEMLISSLGGIYSLYLLSEGKENPALGICTAAVGFLATGLIVTDAIENKLINGKIDNIRDLNFSRDAKVKEKRLGAN